MAVKIRLMRLGRKKRPFYRVVAIDSRKSRNGQYIEKIGHFDPIASDDKKLLLDKGKAISWLEKGAIATGSASKLLSSQGILAEFNDKKIPRKKKKRRKGKGNPMAEKIKIREELKKKKSQTTPKKELAKKKKSEDSKKSDQEEKAESEVATSEVSEEKKVVVEEKEEK